MLRAFVTVVKAKYQIQADVLSEDKPPSNFVLMMKNCEAVGRKDLSDQILMYWRKFLQKYPEKRANIAAAVAHGTNSIKKHLFGGKDFVIWLKDQEDITPEQKKSIQEVTTILPKDVPAIATPKKAETQEDWLAEAARTKEALASAKKAFADVREYIKYLEKEAEDLKRKISDYGPGGAKSKTKDGSPHAYTKRVPKWEEVLKGILVMLEDARKEITASEAKFKEAVADYNSAPITTVAFEKKAQDNLENVLALILDMKDLDKKREMLAKLNDTLGGKQETTGSIEVDAGISDRIRNLLVKFKDALKSFKEWFAGINKAVTAFGKLAAIRY